MNIYITTSTTPLLKSEQRNFALRLLDYALKHEFGVEQGLALVSEIVRTEQGKPYFKNADTKFNYSHCKYGVACIVAQHEVGVDIQEIKSVKPALIKRVCCNNEIEVIQNEEAKGFVNEAFIKIWVQKEAYSKFTGRGFAENFKSIDTTKFPSGLAIRHKNLYIAAYHKNINDVTPQLVQAELP